jgi:hypothetical protein
MKVSKSILGLLGLVLSLMSFNANAWFFFFIPGSVTSKISDGITGSEGESCVSDKAKVGDTITSATGNTAIVKSLSGTSSRCQAPGLPIRALLQFNYSFSSKAGIELPEGFKPKELSGTQSFNGLLLSAQDSSKSIGISVAAQPNKPGRDGGTLAKNISSRLLAAVDDGVISNEEQLSVGGLPAYRFRMVGKNKGMFGRSFTYVVTVLVGKDELVQVNANCLTSDFDKYKETLERFAFDVKGLNGEHQPANQVSIPGGVSNESPVGQGATPIPPREDVNGGQPANQIVEIKATPSATIPTTSALQVQQQSSVQATPREGTAPSATSNIPQKLRELDQLFKDGILNKNEYESKKSELLKAL